MKLNERSSYITRVIVLCEKCRKQLADFSGTGKILAGTGRGRGPTSRGRGGDGDRPYGDGKGTGTDLAGTGGDGDEMIFAGWGRGLKCVPVSLSNSD
jgi:hypothetical protein